MFDKIKSWFHPTITIITIEKEKEEEEETDPIQNGVDMVAEGINFLLEHDFEYECMADLLRQMADDVEKIEEMESHAKPILVVSDKRNIIHLDFKSKKLMEDTPESEDDQ